MTDTTTPQPTPALTAEVLDELDRLESAATAGPWLLTAGTEENRTQDEANAIFLTTLRNHAPALIAAARRTQEVMDAGYAYRDEMRAAVERAIKAEAERDAAEARVTSLKIVVDVQAARIATLEAERVWRPIETAPRDGKPILIASYNEAGNPESGIWPAVEMVRWDKSAWLHYERSTRNFRASCGDSAIAGWQPLPPLLETTESEERGDV